MRLPDQFRLGRAGDLVGSGRARGRTLVFINCTTLVKHSQSKRSRAPAVVISRCGGEPLPRQADPQLEHRILDAACRRWSRAGEKALTMRDVAKRAGQTT